jgi:sulfatase maturation enzyme AslB (radical SAM superfamily)
MKHIVCSKMWTDVNLNIPTKEIRNCCKRQPSKLSVEELKSLGQKSFTEHKILVQDKKFMVENNELPSACYYCKSTWPNSIWNNWNDWRDRDWSEPDLKNLYNVDIVGQIEIMLGITCNQTCMYCTEHVSSLWADLKGIPIVQDKEWEETALKNLFEYIEKNRCQDNKHVWYNFLGGEPLLEPRIFNILETIIDTHTRNFFPDKLITFNMTTNLNVKPKTVERYLEIVEHNPNFRWTMSVSIDTIGKQGEEIRDGLIFERFAANLETLFACKKFSNINILPAVSCLSIPTQHELISWFIDLALKYKTSRDYGHSWNIGTNVVTWPEAMHPGVLPKFYKESLDECIAVMDRVRDGSPSVVENYITHLNNLKAMLGSKRSEQYLLKSKEWYESQGKLKNKDYFEIFPFLKDVLNYD